jgi:hypothetical protein
MTLLGRASMAPVSVCEFGIIAASRRAGRLCDGTQIRKIRDISK